MRRFRASEVRVARALAAAALALAVSASTEASTATATAPGAMEPARAAVVGFASQPAGGGWWTTDARGVVRGSGAAQDHGSLVGTSLNQPITGMAATPSGQGYWLVAADGGVFSFGDAEFFGSTGALRLVAPVVAMAATPSGRGYWLVAADGGVFSFGDAAFFGSTGAIRLQRPVVGIAPAKSAQGYWLVASDGGIFAFGGAGFFGSMGGRLLQAPVVGALGTNSGAGYWLLGRDGGVFSFGDAQFHGSPVPSAGLSAIGMAARPAAEGPGYVVVDVNGVPRTFGPAGGEPPAPTTTTVGPTTTVAPTTSTTAPPPQGEDAVRRSLVAWFNDERAARGLPALAVDPDLQAKADEWVRDPRFATAGHETPEEWGANPRTKAFFAYGEGVTTQTGAMAGAGGAHTSLFGSSRHRSLYGATTARPGTVALGIGVRCHDGVLDVVLDVAQRRQSVAGEPNEGNDLSFPSNPPPQPQVHADATGGPRC